MLADLEVKESVSREQPFNRMLVRLKREIIAFGVPGVDPVERPAPKLRPQELKAWLDEGRPVRLLDVRNDYEVALGTFRDATPIAVDHFRDFPAAAARLPSEMKQEPVVMFCTGGIRCEKAGPYLKQIGFEQVYQLEGGILKYFEECGGEHYNGECFVFDHRVAVDSNVEETATTQCYACQAPLTVEDQQSPAYVANESCPYCYETPAARAARVRAERQAAIERVTRPLPGSRPYDNVRPMNVPGRCNHQTLLDFLDHLHPHFGRDNWQAACDADRIHYQGQPAHAERVVRGGERYEHLLSQVVEPDVAADIRLLHEDESILVIDKPAPLPVHPSGRYNRNTLTHILHEVYRPDRPSPAHRLDANTSGVVVLSRTRAIASRLQPQFEAGEVCKEYLARIHGTPEADTFVCDAAIGKETTLAGARAIVPDGLAAVTEFTVLERMADGTSLVRAIPLTGRTNQIRLHLWHLGYPIYGDPAYLVGGRSGNRQTLAVDDPPMCLHAEKLTFNHPLSGERVTYCSPPPDWSS